jgi:preprotein translocase subunit SecD
MSSDYIPRLRSELLRAGATQPSRLRRPHPARALRPLAAAAAVALVVVAVVLAFPHGSESPNESAANTVELSYRVDPSDSASAARVMRERLEAAGVRGARVSASGGTLAITAPASARADVAALTAPGRFALYDWEASVLGPRGVPAPGDAKVTGGQDAGHASAISKAEAAARGGQVVRALGGASDGWFALGGTPALTNADLARVRADVFDVRTGDPIVAIDLTTDGGKKFTELTRRIAERGAAKATAGSGLEAAQHFAIVVDDRIASVPFIDFRQNPDGIDGASGIQISGDLTRESARQLAALLSAGPLPASFEPADQAP